MKESDIIYQNINDDEITRYAAVVLDKELIQKHELQDYIMVRKSKFGVKPTITGREMEHHWKPERSSWLKPARPMDDIIRKKLLSVLVSEEVKHVMTRHMFRFGDNFYEQSDGGSIGSVLTGEVAKARTIIFLRKLRSVCENLGLKMYLLKMFVDDVLAMMRFPGRGYVFRDGFLYQDVDQQRKDKDEDSDVVTAKLIVEIANNLENESDIQMTFDAPSRNASEKMPVLDLQVWCRDDKLLFMFYEKPMVSSYVIHRDSALSWNVKKISLAGEVCRRYLNTSPCLVDEGMVGDLIDKFGH